MKKNTEAFHSISSEINDAVAKYSLKRSSKYLADHYGKKVLILLDEYDTPMQEDGLAFDGKEVLVDGGHRYIKNLWRSSVYKKSIDKPHSVWLNNKSSQGIISVPGT